MQSPELEKLQYEVAQGLCTMSRDHLVNLCDSLSISSPEFRHVSDKNRTSLISMISNHLQREELRELEDDGMAEHLLLMDK